jgi:multicomponent Na+:H+ antiporter subunit B
MFSVFKNYKTQTELNKTAMYYNSNEVKEVGAANIVTAIVVTYRGLDTLGEVTVLFLATLIIGFILKNNTTKTLIKEKSKPSEILVTGSKILVPGSIILGVYIFINGHLTPGGGFQGGAVIGSAIVLLLLANPYKIISKKVMHFIESTSGFFYVIIGILGLIIAGGFLDSRILPIGNIGKLISAGIIPIIYSLIGLKVGAEISGIVNIINETETTEEI